MRRALIYSLIFHIILFSFALFLKEQKKEAAPDYFYTRIITPDELNGFNLPPADLQEPKKLFRQRTQPPQKTAPQKRAGTPRGSPHDLSKIQKPQTNQYSKTENEPVIPDSFIRKDDSQYGETAKKQFSEPSAGRSFDKFDKEIIGKLAQKETEKKTDNPITFSTKEYQYQGYMQRLKEKIEGIWKYPSDAALKGIYGDLYIRFTIKKNGRLGAVDLIRTSGHKSLDDAALKALRDAEPYWPLPDEWGRDALTITGHFVYTHYGSYIR